MKSSKVYEYVQDVAKVLSRLLRDTIQTVDYKKGTFASREKTAAKETRLLVTDEIESCCLTTVYDYSGFIYTVDQWHCGNKRHLCRLSAFID